MFLFSDFSNTHPVPVAIFKNLFLSGSQGKIKNAEEEIERLTAELEEMKNRPPADAPNSDVAALIAEAEENVRASTQKTIDDLRADIEKKPKEIDKKQKQLDKLKNNGLEEENKQLKESVSEAERKTPTLRRKSNGSKRKHSSEAIRSLLYSIFVLRQCRMI